MSFEFNHVLKVNEQLKTLLSNILNKYINFNKEFKFENEEKEREI